MMFLLFCCYWPDQDNESDACLRMQSACLLQPAALFSSSCSVLFDFDERCQDLGQNSILSHCPAKEVGTDWDYKRKLLEITMRTTICFTQGFQ